MKQETKYSVFALTLITLAGAAFSINANADTATSDTKTYHFNVEAPSCKVGATDVSIGAVTREQITAGTAANDGSVTVTCNYSVTPASMSFATAPASGLVARTDNNFPSATTGLYYVLTSVGNQSTQWGTAMTDGAVIEDGSAAQIVPTAFTANVPKSFDFKVKLASADANALAATNFRDFIDVTLAY